MPPRASTSKLAQDGQQQSRSPSVKSGRGKHADSDMSMMMMEEDGGVASSDDELLDDEEDERQQQQQQQEYSEQASNSSRPKNGASSSRARPSKGRSSANASVAGGEDHQLDTPDTATTSTTGTTMSKEEAALADRRRRNRETQRAIRKKKANRLQEAEVKVSLYETELEKLKVRLREMELENTNLKREIEDWRMGRIHANPTIIAATQHQHHHHPLPHRQAHQRVSPAAATSSVAASHNLGTWEDRHHLPPYGSNSGLPYAAATSSAKPYQLYDPSSEDRKILGKRRQSFDAVHPDPHNLPQSTLPRSFPSPSHQADFRKSPSVLQPVPTAPHGRLTPDTDYLAKEKLSPEHPSHPPAVDTLSNGEGSYGGSDPSPSSAGTVVPSYTSTFTVNAEDSDMLPSSTIISEAVQAVRRQEAAVPKDSVSRSQSLVSTVSTPISDSSLSSTNKRSYDDYHDIWTSVSTGTTSQSQSDSLGSMSSYSRHASASALPGATSFSGKAVLSPGSASVADGMILSMSRQSLCASPVSIAEEHDEPAQAFQPARDLSAQVKVKPSLPSLSSTLTKGHYQAGPRSPERTSSLPLPTVGTMGSPPQAYLPHMHSHTQAHPHHAYHGQQVSGYPAASTSPSIQNRTLPPISSIYQNRQDTLPHLGSQANVYRSASVTRNGRGRTTSYPALPDGDLESQRASHGNASSFNWPTSPKGPGLASSSSFGGPILPLPRRAGTRPPMSSTRDDSPSAFDAESAKEEAMVMSPTQVDDSAVMDGETAADSHSHGTDKRQPQRRKSTYEDFVEVFGA